MLHYVSGHAFGSDVQLAVLNPQPTLRYTDEYARRQGFDVFDGFWMNADPAPSPGP